MTTNAPWANINDANSLSDISNVSKTLYPVYISSTRQAFSDLKSQGQGQDLTSLAIFCYDSCTKSMLHSLTARLDVRLTYNWALVIWNTQRRLSVVTDTSNIYVQQSLQSGKLRLTSNPTYLLL